MMAKNLDKLTLHSHKKLGTKFYFLTRYEKYSQQNWKIFHYVGKNLKYSAFSVQEQRNFFEVGTFSILVKDFFQHVGKKVNFYLPLKTFLYFRW